MGIPHGHHKRVTIRGRWVFLEQADGSTRYDDGAARLSCSTTSLQPQMRIVRSAKCNLRVPAGARLDSSARTRARNHVRCGHQLLFAQRTSRAALKKKEAGSALRTTRARPHCVQTPSAVKIKFARLGCRHGTGRTQFEGHRKACSLCRRWTRADDSASGRAVARPELRDVG